VVYTLYMPPYVPFVGGILVYASLCTLVYMPPYYTVYVSATLFGRKGGI